LYLLLLNVNKTSLCVAKTNKRLIKLWLVNIAYPRAALSGGSSGRPCVPVPLCPSALRKSYFLLLRTLSYFSTMVNPVHPY